MRSKGQSIIEILIGVALGAFLIAAGAGLIAPALRTNTQVATVQAEAQLGNELLGNVRAFSQANWTSLLSVATGSGNPYYISAGSSPFLAVHGIESVSLNGVYYQRYFYVNDVYRDNNGNVTTTAINYDPSSKQIIVVVNLRGSFTGAIGGWATTSPMLAELESDNGNSWTTNGSTIYAIGGYGTDGGGEQGVSIVQTATASSTTGALNNWVQTTDYPTASGGIYVGVAGVNGNYLYYAGGVDGAQVATVHYAQLSTDSTINSWLSGTSLPSALRDMSGTAYKGYFYIAGGQSLDQGGSQTTTVLYSKMNSNGSLGEWKTTTAIPSTYYEYSPPDVFAYNGNLYLAAGVNNPAGDPIGSNHVYRAAINSDGTLGAWIETASSTLCAGDATLAVGFIVQDNGNDCTTGAVSTTVADAPINADGSVGPWKSIGTMPTPNNTYPVLLGTSNAVYLLSGYDGTRGVGTTTVWYAPLAISNASAVSSTYTTYVTRLTNNAFDQTDWSGGSGQTGPATVANSKFSVATNTVYTTPGSITVNPPPAKNISLVDSNLKTLGSGTTLGAAFMAPVSAGNLVVVGIAAFNATINTPTDNQGNTYHLANSTTVIVDGFGNTLNMSLYYAQNVTSTGGTFNVTSTLGSSGSFSVAILNYKGAATSSVLDQTNSNAGTATSTTFTSNNVTTATDKELYVGVVGWSQQENVSSTSGFSTILYQGNASNLQDISVSQKIVAATTTAATWSSDTADYFGALIATFKPAP